MKAREVSRVQQRAAAHRVEVGDRDGRVLIVYGVIRLAPANIGTDVEAVLSPKLPVRAVARVVLGPVMLTLFQAYHLQAGNAAEPPGRSGTTGSRPDDHDICGLGGHGLLLRQELFQDVRDGDQHVSLAGDFAIHRSHTAPFADPALPRQHFRVHDEGLARQHLFAIAHGVL